MQHSTRPLPVLLTFALAGLVSGTSAVSTAASPAKASSTTTTTNLPKTGVSTTKSSSTGSSHLLCRGPLKIGVTSIPGTLVFGKPRTKAGGAGSRGQNLAPSQCAWADRPWTGSTRVEIRVLIDDFPSDWVSPILTSCAHDPECIVDFEHAARSGSHATVDDPLKGGILTWPRAF